MKTARYRPPTPRVRAVETSPKMRKTQPLNLISMLQFDFILNNNKEKYQDKWNSIICLSVKDTFCSLDIDIHSDRCRVTAFTWLVTADVCEAQQLLQTVNTLCTNPARLPFSLPVTPNSPEEYIKIAWSLLHMQKNISRSGCRKCTW